MERKNIRIYHHLHATITLTPDFWNFDCLRVLMILFSFWVTEMIPGRYKNLFPSLGRPDNRLDYEDENEVSSKERKGHMLWKKVKYQLVEYHSLPGYLRDNEFIHGYYRAEWPLKHVLLSIFKIHNETLNVWT